jgi:hypothetical protein
MILRFPYKLSINYRYLRPFRKNQTLTMYLKLNNFLCIRKAIMAVENTDNFVETPTVIV